MDDMANAFYKRGEHSTRNDIKEYCLKHYLDIKLPTEDHFDQALASNADILISYFGHAGRDPEASLYQKKLFDYLQRTKPTDPDVIASSYVNLAQKLAKNHQPVEAESALRRGFAIKQHSTLILLD
jgi:hypothetical protein